MPSNRSELTPEYLLEEKSLLQVWLKTGRYRLEKVNWLTAVAVVLAVLIGTFPSDYATLTNQIRVIADLGLSFSITILGFLIAGFTIFATLSKVEMFLEMARRTEPKTGLDYLKYNLFAFIGVFAEYLAFTFFCLMVKLLCFTGGPATHLIDHLPFADVWRRTAAQAFLLTESGFFVFVLMQLKSFLFNIHHVVMTSIAWSIPDDETSKQPSETDPQLTMKPPDPTDKTGPERTPP